MPVAETSPRKLAVILHADVVTSTKLVRMNETLAHERIRDVFRRFSETIDAYGGIAHELRGDALVAEFNRASDAVAASLAFQTENTEFNSTLEDAIKPELRIGIAMGEVVIADNTVTGDGVVLAQRLEQLAASGSLCIQDAAYQTLPKRLPFEYENLGDRELKGFDDPIRAFSVALRSGAPIPAPEPHGHTRDKGPGWQTMVPAVFGVLIAVGGGLAWWQPWVPREEPASVERMAFSLPGKPSIAVLPFTNMSGDAEQEYFVDGMTEDLITDLSKISELFVIARNSTFSYKGKSVKVRQVAEELGVRYVLEGSVRRAGNQVRINAQLIDATSGGHLWAERYDGSPQDIFALQDKVTSQIVTALEVSLTGRDDAQPAGRSTDNADAHDAFLQGWAHYKLGTPADLARSIPHFEEAVRLDSSYSLAHAALASVYWDAYVNEWAFDLDMPSFRAESRANEHLEKALEAPTPLAHALQSRMYLSFGFADEAVAEAESAVALDGNDATAHAALANALVLADRPAQGADAIGKSMRLDPHYPPGYLTILGAAQFGMEQYEEAAVTFERAIKRNPEDELPRIYLAASYGHLERLDDGEAVIQATNYLRNTRGMSALSMEKAAQTAYSPLKGGIDFKAFGGKASQERVRSGLSPIPALSWQYLVTVHLVLGAGNTWFEVEGATKIDIATAKTFHDRGVLFVDTSDASVWKKGHIPGAVNLPWMWHETVPTNPRLEKPSLSKIAGTSDEVVFGCVQSNEAENCSASYEAAKAVAWGYEKVYWLSDARHWREAGYPLEQGE